jgi:pyruvate formate lyase activating enzyme
MLDAPPTPRETLRRARSIALANGVHYAYTGNVLYREGGSTWCHRCGALVIEREGYRLGVFAVSAAGCCEACGARIPGVFATT